VPGTEWGAAIIAGIDGCKVMVLIFSASANESPQVRREVEQAISKGMTVIPCRIEDVSPEGALEYALGNTHWLDVFTPPVERQMKCLAESVESLLPPDHRKSKVAGGPPPLVSEPACPKGGFSWRSIFAGGGHGKQKLVAAAGSHCFFSSRRA
jgi:hypothetical protein